ncbi:hypothetical protein NC796_04365 [Aliifodinibius sp. S!AR15-10]|uniref:hypothetical protein n=1 Tax=Aliifodinibius sp. S!AR15-10 TaxID=2950437 RepID=UPI002859F198|nr:hypothetical protein [Aliifodinibius sp. S!AR15-10]MDR8390363.1 hypothetical protein [Aliifodinibius sp. S!AR15-10]
MKNITKVDNKDFRGYWVRIQRDHRKFSKRFRRRDYDSWEEAREAAIKYRDEWLAEWEKLARNPDQKIQYQNSVTGEIGIHKTTKNGVVYLGVSYINEDGEQKIKAFRAGKPEEDGYEESYDEAMEEAKEFRDEVNMKRFGVRWVNYKRRKQEEKKKEAENSSG